MVIGLTGGIACGKTTISKVLHELGAEIIDVDSLGHQLIKDEPLVYNKIIDRFGRGILDDKGEIDRSKLGVIVFNNQSDLKSLNEIVHPLLIELTKKKIGSSKGKMVVVDAALLIELNLTSMVGHVILVSANEDTQLKRLLERGLSKEDALKRIRSQMSSKEKERFADFVIYNNGELEDAIRQVKLVWNNLLCLNHCQADSKV